MTSDNMILMSIVKIVPHIQSTHFKFFWKGEEGGGWRLNDDCSFEKLSTYLTRHLNFLFDSYSSMCEPYEFIAPIYCD